MRRPKPVHQLTAAQFDALFKTEDDCIAYLVAPPLAAWSCLPALWQRQGLCARIRSSLAMRSLYS